jgi:hypothetical protein
MNSDADFMIDLDALGESTEQTTTELIDRIKFIRIFTPFKIYRIQVRETARGFHVYLWVDGQHPTPAEAVLVQMALGSDYRREIFNYRRVWPNKHPERWNILFKAKYDNEGNLISEEKLSENAVYMEEKVHLAIRSWTEEEP